MAILQSERRIKSTPKPIVKPVGIIV